MADESQQRDELHDEGGNSATVVDHAQHERTQHQHRMVRRNAEPGELPAPEHQGRTEGTQGELFDSQERPSSPIIGGRRSRSSSMGSRNLPSPRPLPAEPDEPCEDHTLNDFHNEEQRDGINVATVVIRGDVRERFTNSRWSGILAWHAGEPGTDGHTHITFPDPGGNKWRTLKWLGQRLGLTQQQLDALGLTFQVVRSFTRWLVYLARFGVNQVVCANATHAAVKFGKKVLQYLVNCGGDQVDNALPTDCVPNFGDKNHASAEAARNKRKRKAAPPEMEVDYINTLCDRYHVKTIGQFMRIINMDEFKTLYGLSSSFKERVRTIIEYRSTQRKVKLNKESFWETYYNEYLNDDTHTMTENEAWLALLFKKNKIKLAEFLAWVEIIADRHLTKVNTLLLFGKTTSGKTLILESILQLKEPTKLSAMNNNSPFYLAQLLNSNLGVMEEITVSEANQDDFKKLLGGEVMHVPVKYQNTPEILHRVPIFASTNNRLGGFLADGDRDALQSRTKTFEFNLEIRSRGDRGGSWTIPEPPSFITPENWWNLYKRERHAINRELQRITGQYVASHGRIGDWPIRKRVPHYLIC